MQEMEPPWGEEWYKARYYVTGRPHPRTRHGKTLDTTRRTALPGSGPGAQHTRTSNLQSLCHARVVSAVSHQRLAPAFRGGPAGRKWTGAAPRWLQSNLGAWMYGDSALQFVLFLYEAGRASTPLQCRHRRRAWLRPRSDSVHLLSALCSLAQVRVPWSSRVRR